MECNAILSHQWDDGQLVLKVRFNSGHVFYIPFAIVKKDVPLELASYIQEHVVEIDAIENTISGQKGQ